MKMKTGSVWRVALALVALGALTAGSSARGALVAHYTFDDVDTTKSGDGSMNNPFNFSISDIANGNTATNVATEQQSAVVPLPGGTGVYGTQMITGQPGVFGQSQKFWRDPSDFNLASANGTYTIAPGVVPSGAAQRTISVWFNQEIDITSGGSQDKLWGYGTNVAGQALDLSLEGGGLRTRHFGGNITYGSGFDFQSGHADGGWHLATLRVNAGATTYADVDVFLDGVQLAVSATGGTGITQSINTVEQNNPATGFPGHGFGIGTSSERAGGSSQNGIAGLLDDMRIYDTALSDSDIKALWVAGGIPEPASAVLMILGFTGSLLAVRRRHS